MRGWDLAMGEETEVELQAEMEAEVARENGSTAGPANRNNNGLDGVLAANKNRSLFVPESRKEGLFSEMFFYRSFIS